MNNQNTSDPNFTDSIEQLEAMRIGVEYRQPVTVRGLTVMMRPLTVSEHINISRSIARDLEMIPLSQQTAVMQNILLAQKCLCLASTESPDPKSIPALPELILGNMTNDELLALYKLWNGVVSRVDPNFEDIPDEEIIALADRLKDEILVKKNPSAVIALSFSELSNLALFLLTKDI